MYCIVQVYNKQINTVFVSEHKLYELLKRVQNRQYDDQRGTSLTAFKDMPDFLRLSSDNEAVCDRVVDNREVLQQSNIELGRWPVDDCRHDDSFHSGLSLTPSRFAFSEEFDSVLPSNDNAEQYFAHSARVSSPDFSDSRLLVANSDLGMASPIRKTTASEDAGGGWTLIGDIANVIPPTTKLDVPSNHFDVPVNSLSSSSRHEQLEQNVMLSRYKTTAACRPNDLDVYIECRDPESVCSTPSPTTHDLLFFDGECFVSKAIPYVDDDAEIDEKTDVVVYGVV